jgi:hypothetical protein
LPIKGAVRTPLTDQRTNAFKYFAKLVDDIKNDLGGHDLLSTVELALVEAFAGSALTLHDLNTRMLLGQQIEISDHATAVSALVKVASRIGIKRRSKDITPDLDTYLRHRREQEVVADD